MSLPLALTLLVALAWLAPLAIVAFYRRWWILLAANMLPAGLTTYLFVEGSRMASNEDTDQAAIGVLIMAGFCMFGTVGSLVASALGAIAGLVARHWSAKHIRNDLIQEG